MGVKRVKGILRGNVVEVIEKVSAPNRLPVEVLIDEEKARGFSKKDPLYRLIGSFEDEARDVSRNKYSYIAKAVLGNP